jgi:hypothetical protein
MAVPPNPLAINPLYNPIILENRGQPQFVLGRVNFLGPQSGLASDSFSLKSDVAEFSFFNPATGTILSLQRELTGDGNDSLLVITRNGPVALPLILLRVQNVFVNTLNSKLASSTFLTIPNSLKITTQGDAPKLPSPNPAIDPGIEILQQGQLYPTDNSRIIFAYPFSPLQPNIIRFDISLFPNSMVFVRNRLGTADLPVQTNIDPNGILTITGIPLDAGVPIPGVCAAMLMII